MQNRSAFGLVLSGLVVLLCTGFLCQTAIAGYKVCKNKTVPDDRNPERNETAIVCDKADCPIGMKPFAYNPGPCPTAGGSRRPLGPEAQTCVSSENLHNLDYRGGHKTRTCQLAGFDKSRGWTCIRDCSKPCVRANIRKLGWRDGNKNKYCKVLGYDGVHSPAGTKYYQGGYCYKGDPHICANN